MYYFRQINEQVDSKNFAFYVIVKGRQLDIYKYCNKIVDLTVNYANSYFRGFYAFHKVTKYVTHLVKPLVSASSSSIRQFHNHCEVIIPTVRKLNETWYLLDNIIEICRQKIIALESANEE